MDISADLTELGRTPVTVVCAGAKSVLDIPRTLEVCACVCSWDEGAGQQAGIWRIASCGSSPGVSWVSQQGGSRHIKGASATASLLVCSAT